MISGEFDNLARPVIRATLKVAAANSILVIPFLVDTGAVDTVIMATDAARLLVNFANLRPSVPIRRLGGSIKGHPVDNVEIILVGKGTAYTYYADILIVDPAAFPSTFPSILGCQVWGRWRLSIYGSTRQLDIEPLKPDLKDPP